VFLLFYRPFFSHFIPPTSGYNLVPWETKTPLGLLLLIFGAAFGALLLPTVGNAARVLSDLFSAKISAEADTRQGQSGRTVILVATVVGTLVWAVGLLYVRSRTGTLSGTLSPALLGSLLLLALLWLLRCWAGDRGEKEEAGAERFVSLLLFLATGLILTCEFVVVKDFYGGDSLRMNTIFKFHLQAWVLLAITLAFASDRFLTLMRGVIPDRRALGLTGAVLQAGIVVVFVVWTAVGSWKLLVVKCSHFESKPTLDGLAYAFPEESERRVVGERDMSTEDGRAILWLLDLQRFEYDPKRIILESPGDPYSIYGRVSAFSGIPTPLGVPNHEGIWNGKKVEASSEIKARSRDVETIYRTNDFRKAKQLLEKYGVTHVFWGTVERRKFGAAARKKFEKYMVALKTFEDTTIYSGYQDVPIQEDFVEEVPPRPLAEARELVDPSHPFDQPRGITVGPDGSVYVCNSKKGTVEVFSAEGTWRRTIGAPGQSPGSGQLSPEYSGPGGVAVGPDGALYVADTWNHRVAVFAPDGTYQREIQGDFWGPRNLAFFKDLLIVADTGKHRLVALRPDGSAPRPIGQQGRGLGEFTEPVGLAVHGDSLFVADVGNQRVQVLGPDFLPRAEFPVLGWEDQVGTEAYMAFDSAGRLWLTDSGGNRVQRYSAEGKLEAVFGPVCPPTGTLRAVKGIALRGEEILLSDFGNNRLVIWREN
ncbi:MAG: hypothetical protein HUU16_07295, partial [Candidatus Omnitrophica bacterium]|nr:hypothetical protein [Candidatus Omnitrophota bacterium]